jgi:outer membrane protein assembly factor BamB
MTSRKKSNDESQQNSHRSKPPDGRNRGRDRGASLALTRAYSDGRTGGYSQLIRTLEGAAMLGSIAAVLSTYLLLGVHATELNPASALLIDRFGIEVVGLARIAVVLAAFAALGGPVRRWRPRFAAGLASGTALLYLANGANDLLVLARTGLPESFIVGEVVTFAALVVGAAVVGAGRHEIATGLQHAPNLTPAWSPSPQATAAVAFAVVLVVSGVGPFAGLGGLAVQDHDGLASAAEGDEEWTFSTGDTVPTSPTVVDGTVYIASEDNNLYAIDAATGNEEWSYSTGGYVPSSPVVADGTVYVGSSDNNLHAVDAETGNEEWTYSTGDLVFSSPTVADGTVYIGADDNNLHAVDAETGSEEWTYSTGDIVRSSPTVADGTVYVGSWNGNLYAIDAGTGSEEWSYSTGNSVESAPTVSDGTVYVGSQDSNLYAIDAATGSEEWSYSAPGDWVSSSPTVADGTVYVGSNDNNLYAVDAGTGSEEWTYSTGDRVQSSPTVADGTVYVGSSDNNLYAIDAGTGSEEWSYSTGDSVESSPTVAGGTVYVASFDNNLYAVDTGHDKSGDGSRMFHGTLGHNEEYYGVQVGHPISGTVTDNGGDPVDGATVSTGTGVSTTTGADGSYELTVSETGEYEVTANAENYSASTQTVDVPDGGTTGVDFSLLDAPGSVTFLGSDGSEITDRQTRIELYPVNNETISEDAGFFLDDRSKEPIATGSDSSIALDEAIRGNNYVVAFRSDDSQSETTYRDAAIPVTEITQDWTVRLTGTDAVQVRVAVRDLTAAGNWSSERLHIRADAVDNTTGERTTVDAAALGGENLGTLLLPDRETLDIYAVRDDGAERYLGELNVLKEVSDETVVFDIESPETEWQEGDLTNRTTDDSPHAPLDDGSSPWSSDEDVHYPPTASVTADNSQPVAGETVTFDASGSRAYDDAVIDSYEWTLPDGSTASGETATWTPDADDAGSAHTVEVTVTDDEGTFDTTQYSVYVAEDEASRASPPVADADVATDSPTVGDPITLESISSADDGVSIETTEWDLDADGSFDDATGDTAEIVPEEAGLREVGIRVTDSNGATDSYYISFFVGAEVEDPSSIGGGGGGSGSIGGPLGGGGGDGLGAGQQLAIGVAGLIGYWGWRRVGGPGVVSLAQRALPVARRGVSAALSGVSTVVRGTMGLLGRLLGRGGDA